MSQYSVPLKAPMSLFALLVLIVQASSTLTEIKEGGRTAVAQNLQLPDIPNNYMDPTSQSAADHVVKSDTMASKDRQTIETLFLDETSVNREKVTADVPVEFIGYILRFSRIKGPTNRETIVTYLSTPQNISKINAAIGLPKKEYSIVSIGIGAIGLTHTQTTTTGTIEKVEITKWVCLTVTLGCQKLKTDQVNSKTRRELYATRYPGNAHQTSLGGLKGPTTRPSDQETKNSNQTSSATSAYYKDFNFKDTSQPTPSIGSDTVFDTEDTRIEQFSEFEIEALNVHNELREKHAAPPLILSRKLCNVAQGWIKARANGTNNGEIHNPNSGCGENIYTTTLHNVKGNDPVDAWYFEKYNYYPKQRGMFGHFTQLVWKGIGNEKWKPKQATPVKQYFGIAIGEYDGSRLVVANYYPPGNVYRRYDSNVSDTNPPTEFITDEDLKQQRKDRLDRLCRIRR